MVNWPHSLSHDTTGGWGSRIPWCTGLALSHDTLCSGGRGSLYRALALAFPPLCTALSPPCGTFEIQYYQPSKFASRHFGRHNLQHQISLRKLKWIDGKCHKFVHLVQKQLLKGSQTLPQFLRVTKSSPGGRIWIQSYWVSLDGKWMLIIHLIKYPESWLFDDSKQMMKWASGNNSIWHQQINDINLVHHVPRAASVLGTYNKPTLSLQLNRPRPPHPPPPLECSHPL